MSKKYKTRIEITAPARSKEEAMEIVGDYLSGNIASGIDMKYTTRRIHFYNNPAAKIVAVVLLIGLGFLFSVRTAPLGTHLSVGTCQMAAVQPPLNTSKAAVDKTGFKKEWEEKQTREALDFIKK